MVNADESRGQTERIHEAQSRKYSLEKLKTGAGAPSTLFVPIRRPSGSYGRSRS